MATGRKSTGSLSHDMEKQGDSSCPKSPYGAHWWVIAPPDGATSQGVCRYCGDHRLFMNVVGVRLSSWRHK